MGPQPTRKGQRGFTLIELAVVMIVAATVTAVVAVGIGNIRGASVQAESGKLAVAVRYLYNLSVLNGKVYRLVLDLDGGTYWGEEQQSRDPCKSFQLPGEEEIEAAVAGKSSDAKEQAEGDQPAPKPAFSTAKTRLLKKRKLDKGIVFGGVMTSSQGELATSGQAHIHFFPNGTAERAMVYVSDKDDRDDVMTVEVLALQGSARVHPEELDLDEFFDQG